MPVNFNPAEPFSPQISEKFGAAQEWDKAFPTLAQLYADQGRNFTQASAGTAANITRASEESAKLAGDRINQDNQLYFQRQQQAAQIEAQKQSQIRDIRANEAHQFNQMAFQNMMVSDAEKKDMVRKQNGLDLIRQQLDQKLLTPEEAAPYIAELATGINFTQRRVDNMRAKQMQQAQEMKQQQIASDNQDRALAEKFRLDMAARGITMTAVQDKTTGKWHTIAYDEKSNRIYNPFNEHLGKEGSQKPTTRFGDEAGVFSYKNALPEAEAEAKAAYPPQMEFEPKLGKEVDTNAKERNVYLQKILDRMKSQHDAQTNPQPQQQNQQPQQESQPAAEPKPIKTGDIDDAVKKLKDKGVSGQKLGYLKEMMTTMKSLADKGIAQPLTQDEKRELQSLRNEYERLSKE